MIERYIYFLKNQKFCIMSNFLQVYFKVFDKDKKIGGFFTISKQFFNFKIKIPVFKHNLSSLSSLYVF